MAAAPSGGACRSGSRRNTTARTGRSVPVEIVLDADRDDRGGIRGYFAFVSDISERKAVETALKESERRFRKLYDEAPFGYHEIDTDGADRVDINRTECRLLGYAREAMLGRPIFDFVAAELRETARKAVPREGCGADLPLGDHRAAVLDQATGGGSSCRSRKGIGSTASTG